MVGISDGWDVVVWFLRGVAQFPSSLRWSDKLDCPLMSFRDVARVRGLLLQPAPAPQTGALLAA